MDVKKGYKKRVLKQLENWVNGKSIHNKIDDECTPDFSCCRKVKKTPIKTRKQFQKSYIEKDWEVHEGLCVSFLGNAFLSKKK